MLVKAELVVHREQPGAAASAGLVADVGDEPEPIGPGHQRPDAGLGARHVVGLDGQVRKHTVDVEEGSVHDGTVCRTNRWRATLVIAGGRTALAALDRVWLDAGA